jgi:hypothetical protein
VSPGSRAYRYLLAQEVEAIKKVCHAYDVWNEETRMIRQRDVVALVCREGWQFGCEEDKVNLKSWVIGIAEKYVEAERDCRVLLARLRKGLEEC